MNFKIEYQNYPKLKKEIKKGIKNHYLISDDKSKKVIIISTSESILYVHMTARNTLKVFDKVYPLTGNYLKNNSIKDIKLMTYEESKISFGDYLSEFKIRL